MTTELRLRNQAQQLYVRALSTAWRNNVQLWDPSVWFLRDPEIEEKMLRDADIAHAVGFRRHLIAGRDWKTVPKYESSPRAQMSVAVASGLIENIRHFTNARMNLARAFFSGARFAEIRGTTRKLALGDGVVRDWWVPVELVDMDKRRFRIVPEREKFPDGTTQVRSNWEVWNLGEDRFIPQSYDGGVRTIRHVYADDEGQLGHGRALREALGWWWYAKEHVFNESLQAVERWAQGIISAKVQGARDAATGLPNTKLIEEWRLVLEDMRARHILVHDIEDEVEMVKMDGQGWQLLHTLRDELRSTIFTLILGANLTTAANEGGSYALAEIQENSTEALVQYDREALEETLSDDLIGCLWEKNWANLWELGIALEPPRFSITQEKRQDPKERAEVASTLNGMGVELALEDVLEQTGFRKPEVGEEVIEGGSAEPAPFPGGFPGAFKRGRS